MLSYLLVFSAGALLGTIVMGVIVALVSYRDARDDW
jgi:hypothetical protein